MEWSAELIELNIHLLFLTACTNALVSGASVCANYSKGTALSI